MRELYNYDFFISIEDDMLFTVDMVEAFRRHCNKIQASIGYVDRPCRTLGAVLLGEWGINIDG